MPSMTVIGFIFLCIAVAVEPLLAAVCTITEYNANAIKEAEEKCTDIRINNIEVPPGVGLNLNLKQGSHLTFHGRITWGYYEWNGPLVNITGTNLVISGAPGHVLDGRGHLWWDGLGERGPNKPVLFVLHGTNYSLLRDLHVINTPYHAFWIEHSREVMAQNIYIDSSSGNALGRSTDGFNVWTSHFVTLQGITVYNQDDCIAIKSGTEIWIENIYCHGGHGLSVGSVGGRDYNTVEFLYITNVQIVDSENGVRIKTVFGATGLVANIVYENIFLRNIHKYGIIIQGDYMTTGPTGVATGGVPIRNFMLANITGTVDKTGVNIYVLVKNASSWLWSDINVTGGEVVKPCQGIPTGVGNIC